MRLHPVVVAALVAAGSGAAVAGPAKKELVAAAGAPPARPGMSPAERAKWDRELRRRIGKKPPALINVHYTWTDETVAFDAGVVQTPPAEVMNHFLRCHFTNQQKQMDPRLFRAMLDAARHFKVARVDIISAFRSPKYNLLLRKKGRYIARNSQHTVGHAVDFRLPGVTTERLRDWARRLGMGGVGYYPGDAFVHIDTGPVRFWTDAE
jgi:uncharacterized protein YcbK (DUF882 family)